MAYEIPSTVVTYPKGSAPPTIDVSGGMRYNPTPHDPIEVLLWVRYPDYDFIFGVPAKHSEKHEKEIAFFQYRDTRRNMILQGMYLDVQETKEMVEGFTALLEKSKEHSPHLWKQ